MSKQKEIWNTKENAEAYDVYALNFPMYKDTSKDLVASSNIKPGMTVVDLAAGTGATTQAIIDKTNGNVRIIAVDQAEEMLKKAKEKFANQNVQFLVSEAEKIDQVINEPVDAIICNSAFWQMRASLVLKSVSNILKQGGIFVFNLPDSIPMPCSLDDLILWGKEVGLILVSQSVKVYNKTADEMLAFNEIPVMKGNFETENDRKKHIAKLQEESNKNTPSQRQWIYFVFRKEHPLGYRG